MAPIVYLATPFAAIAEAPLSGPYVSIKYKAALRKINRLPHAKGMPASTGEIQCTSLRADQPNQKSLLRLAIGLHNCDLPGDLPYRHAEASHLSAKQSILGGNGGFALFEHALMVFGIVESIHEDIRADGKNDSKTNGSEREAVLPGVETVDRLEGIRVCGEECKQDREGEGGVQAEEEYGGLREQHVQWSEQCDCQEQLHESQALDVRLRRRWYVEPFCASVQDDLLVSFGHAHHWDSNG